MALNKKLLTDLGKDYLKGKRVVVRVDFNTPQDKSTGKVTDDKKIRAAFETISYLIDSGAKVILCSHLGRPDGQYNEKYDMKPVAEAFEKVLKEKYPNANFKLTDEIVLNDERKDIKNMKDGDVVLLQNVRFNPGEEKNDPAFSKKLASVAQVYVNDAFGTAHREHSSTSGIIDYLDKRVPAVAGRLVEKELEYLGDALLNPKRPFVVIFGGLKVSDKIEVMKSLVSKLEKGDSLVIGGAMAYTFLAAKGINVGNSIIEEGQIDNAKAILDSAKEKGFNIILPEDHVIVKDFNDPSTLEKTDGQEIKDGFMAVDIGPKTIAKIRDVVLNAKTIFNNGPMGAFETPDYANGTFEVMKAMAELNGKDDARTIIGGGDSANAAKAAGVEKEISHISTGGGATMEFIQCDGKFATMEKLDNKDVKGKRQRRPSLTLLKEKIASRYHKIINKLSK